MDGQHRRRAYARAGNARKKLLAAVVDLANGGDGPAPPELRLYWQCQRYGGLPDAGGLLEQDAGLIERMTTLGAVYEAVEHVRSLKGADIHNMRPSAGRILMWLETMGIQV